ncbi:unnamed protein product [Prunus armeniaca]|uniref:J domain-containing protein n=1 Tax=Prunus armeniaca TaxID=36596 RepID=A0A6J5XWC1_PRUAR|nr:unnamed protein product [Prunus armeniaca]
MDHYKVLGLPRSASKEEIKEAFRKLAVKLHQTSTPTPPRPATNYGGKYRRASSGGSGASSAFENVLRYVTTRAFLLNLSVAGAFLGGMVVVNRGWDALWKMHNAEKSFEETMRSLERSKARKEKP